MYLLAVIIGGMGLFLMIGGFMQTREEPDYAEIGLGVMFAGTIVTACAMGCFGYAYKLSEEIKLKQEITIKEQNQV